MDPLLRQFLEDPPIDHLVKQVLERANRLRNKLAFNKNLLSFAPCIDLVYCHGFNRGMLLIKVPHKWLVDEFRVVDALQRLYTCFLLELAQLCHIHLPIVTSHVV